VPRLIFRSTLVQAAMMVVFSLIAGRLSDLTGRRKSIAMAGSALQGLGLLAHCGGAFLYGILVGVALTRMGHGVLRGSESGVWLRKCCRIAIGTRPRTLAFSTLRIRCTGDRAARGAAILAFSGGDYTLLFSRGGASP